MQIVCAQCQAINRIDPARLRDGPICGGCKTTLLPPAPIELRDANFGHFLARTELPVVVDFWAPWCGPCQQMAPWYAEAARQLQGRALLLKLDTEANPLSAARFGIRSIPTLMIFKNERELARAAGARPAAEIVRWVAEHLD